jgi:hypothetical protein
MYNGEFAKGFVHVLVFATLIWMADHVNGIFGIAIAAFYIYMPIEAYRTARAMEMGLPSPDPFGFNTVFGSGAPRPSAAATANASPGIVAGQPSGTEPVPEEPRSRTPIGAFVLIGLGVLFLLDEMGALHFDWIWRFWPLILIVLGIRILMQRQRRDW